MADMTDVRKALWDAYQRATRSPEYCGKSSEAYCEVRYPCFWDAPEDEAKFLKPEELMVYSYALGPSRQHTFRYGPKDREVNYHTWESPDPYAKAVEVIGKWIMEFESPEDDA